MSIIIPIYFESKEVVERLYNECKSMGAEVIIVDDGDTTQLDVEKLTYTPHRGYGYAIKQGIKAATRPVVCTLDGDGQHSVDDAWKLWTMYCMIPDIKMVVGTRWGLNEPLLRQLGRKVLNFIATCWAGHYLIDLNSGMRIFDRKLTLDYEPILCDTFSFTTSITISMVTDGYKVAWFPIDVKPRACGKSKVRVIQDGLVTLWYILTIGFALRTRRLRSWLRHISGR